MPQARKSKISKAPESTEVLTISRETQKPLSKQQQAFNRLIKRIEKLQQEIATTDQVLNEKLEYYGKHIHPLEVQMNELREKVVKLLFPFYTSKKPLSKRDKHTLKDILTQQLNSIFGFKQEEPDDELKQIFEALEGISLEEAEKQDAEELKKEMTDMFESFGFKMNLDDLHADMTQEEMARKMQEMGEQFFRQAENMGNGKAGRKKTKKQLEKEEREKQIAEAKNKNIGRIYKQLAKALHPDLEQDIERKAYKEVRMRELTAAYDNNDLHTLLRLELEWLQNEENNLDKLTDEKLSIYNEVLKEQAAELEEEAFMRLEHPRYHPLRRFVMFPMQLKSLNLSRKMKDYEEMLKSMKKSVRNLQGDFALEEVNEIIWISRTVY